MNITACTDNRICVELTREDMAELDITYEDLDYSNIETRRVLWTLLDEARRSLGLDIYLTQRMLIEAVPDDAGGCSIFFTVMDEQDGGESEKSLVKVTDSEIVCQSDSIDSIGALSKVLMKSGKIKKSELYTDGKGYRLILHPKAPVTQRAEALISEFCDICPPSSAPYTYERWKLLASPDAIGILGALS